MVKKIAITAYHFHVLNYLEFAKKNACRLIRTNDNSRREISATLHVTKLVFDLKFGLKIEFNSKMMAAIKTTHIPILTY